MIDALWFRLLGWAERIRREERGDGLVNWVVLAVGLAAAAAAVVALLRPALTDAAQKIVNVISGG
jgi:ribosomal protein S12 methylthiotransferase accessory factor YcaO